MTMCYFGPTCLRHVHDQIVSFHTILKLCLNNHFPPCCGFVRVLCHMFHVCSENGCMCVSIHMGHVSHEW